MEYVIKRDGTKVPFDKSKIVNAIEKAMTNTTGGVDSRVSNAIADYIADIPDTMSVEQIQDIVIDQLKNSPLSDVADAYSRWRILRQEIREKQRAYGEILSICDVDNEKVKQENSNKNPVVNSVQRDYMAGEVSKDLSFNLLLPKDIVDAHYDGKIHFHDSDYFAQHMFNCSLVNLEDMLQNGTVISGTGIDKPHSFSTACNIATQIIAQVASNQYGGQSITLSHLAPFVDVSRKKIAGEVHEEFYDMIQNNEIDKMPNQETINRIVEKRLHKEIVVELPRRCGTCDDVRAAPAPCDDPVPVHDEPSRRVRQRAARAAAVLGLSGNRSRIQAHRRIPFRHRAAGRADLCAFLSN